MDAKQEMEQNLLTNTPTIAFDFKISILVNRNHGLDSKFFAFNIKLLSILRCGHQDRDATTTKSTWQEIDQIFYPEEFT